MSTDARKAYRKRWCEENRVHLREYMREYRKKHYARLELKRKCRLAGVQTDTGATP